MPFPATRAGQFGSKQARFMTKRRGGVSSPGLKSVKSRLGFIQNAKTGAVGGGGIKSIKARLGAGGTPILKSTSLPNSRSSDARERINKSRTIKQLGRTTKTSVFDARNKILAKRSTTTATNKIPTIVGRGVSGGGGGGGTLYSGEPIRNLIITTPNTTPGVGRGNLFHNAMNNLGEYDYFPSSMSMSSPHDSRERYPSTTSYRPEPMLTRTISNNHAINNNYGQFSNTQGRQNFSISPIAPSPRYGSLHSDYMDSSSRSSRRDYMDMDVDEPGLPVRSPLQSRLDSAKFKVRVSNLQNTVSVDDVVELFSDVGDLLSAKSLGAGVVEAIYKNKADCLKAVDIYHNRLLDGRPMKVVFENNTITNPLRVTSSSNPIIPSVTSLKSASGASSAIKLPKSSSAIKIHPDLSAIHKVLFQPTSSSNATKMLFKGAGQ